MSKKLFSLFLTLALVLACVPVLAEGGITVTDMMNREIKLAAPADKVVVLMPGDAEILYALGAQDAIVGVGYYCTTPEEAAVMTGIESLPVVDSGYQTNVEEILKLEPQLVILTAMGHSEDLVNALAVGNVQVVVTDAQDLEGVYTDITLIGTLTGKNAEAEQLIADMKQKFAAISEKAGETGKSLYVDESPLMFGLWSAGKGTYMDDIAGICGLTNIFADIEKHQAVSEEQVLERNPDIIITTNLFDPSWMTEMPADEIKGRAGWENISAIKNDMVVYDPTNAVAIPGPRLTEVAEMLFELVSGGEAEVPAA